VLAQAANSAKAGPSHDCARGAVLQNGVARRPEALEVFQHQAYDGIAHDGQASNQFVCGHGEQ
jgi:hypothetical protein